MKIFRLLYSITTILFLSILFACENEESLIGENFLENESHDIFIFWEQNYKLRGSFVKLKHYSDE